MPSNRFRPFQRRDVDCNPRHDSVALHEANGMVVDPTPVTFDYVRQRADGTSSVYAAERHRVPLALERKFRPIEADMPVAALPKVVHEHALGTSVQHEKQCGWQGGAEQGAGSARL